MSNPNTAVWFPNQTEGICSFPKTREKEHINKDINSLKVLTEAYAYRQDGNAPEIEFVFETFNQIPQTGGFIEIEFDETYLVKPS